MKQYNRILFVAENGTCRAPMAAGILGEYVLKHPVEIGARGMVVLFPEPLNQKAEAVMISNGINLDGYMSAQLTEEDFNGDEIDILTILQKSGLAPSRSEARRNVEQGGVAVDGEAVKDSKAVFTKAQLSGDGIVVKRGKKNFKKVILNTNGQ